MKMRPCRILMIVYGAGVLLSIGMGILGHNLQSAKLFRFAIACFVVTAAVAAVPLVGTCCYLIWDKMKRKPPSNQSNPK